MEENEKIEDIIEGRAVNYRDAKYVNGGKSVLMKREVFDYLIVRDLQLDLADKRIEKLNNEKKWASISNSGNFIFGLGIGIFSTLLISCVALAPDACREAF